MKIIQNLEPNLIMHRLLFELLAQRQWQRVQRRQGFQWQFRMKRNQWWWWQLLRACRFYFLAFHGVFLQAFHEAFHEAFLLAFLQAFHVAFLLAFLQAFRVLFQQHEMLWYQCCFLLLVFHEVFRVAFRVAFLLDVRVAFQYHQQFYFRVHVRWWRWWHQWSCPCGHEVQVFHDEVQACGVQVLGVDVLGVNVLDVNVLSGHVVVELHLSGGEVQEQSCGR